MSVGGSRTVNLEGNNARYRKGPRAARSVDPVEVTCVRCHVTEFFEEC